MTMRKWMGLGLSVLLGCAPQTDAPDAGLPGAEVPDAGQAAPDAGADAGAVDGEDAGTDGGEDAGVSSTIAPCAPSQQGLVEEEGRVEAASLSVDAEGRERVLVRFRRGRLDATLVGKLGGLQRARLPGMDVVAAHLTPAQKEALLARPEVLAVTPDRTVHAMGVGTSLGSLLLGASSALHGSPGEYTPGLFKVQAPDVWDVDRDGVLEVAAPTGAGITVCVIDSGLDLRHPELTAAYAGGYDFVDDDADPSDSRTLPDGGTRLGGGHGTHVSGTIAAQPGAHGMVWPDMDPMGVTGVAPGVRLLMARVLDVNGNGSTSDVVRALAWCGEQGANIASMSLGAGQADDVEREAVAQAVARGMLLVAASGNSGTGSPDTSPPISYPAAYPGVLAVGAIDATKGTVADFTQMGPELALVAPGVDVLSSLPLNSGLASRVSVEGVNLDSHPLEFTRADAGYTGPLVDCGQADSYASCGTGATCEGFVALVDRGERTFRRKVRFATGQGARAVIVINNEPDAGPGDFTLGVADDWVPVASVAYEDGALLRQDLGRQAGVVLSGVDYGIESGTSMATPHVAGVAALVWSAWPTLSAEQLKEVLYASAQDLGEPGRDTTSGYGLVQAKAALQLLEAGVGQVDGGTPPEP